ncbi:uncharacterized protein AKAME5_001665400 [Lates japonicus]|uniref:Uncharacterized protein n=1 Tax=Lates japonicus TaxID=270547 RepID=A0AAD3N346_LATJO|nr:uncharacterized protein AKAME5_001665400 [Lates japonicus]
MTTLRNACARSPQPAIIRYARFSESQQPELYYRSILQLFMLYCCDVDLKSAAYATYELFYSSGTLKSADGLLHSVESVVDKKLCLFEKDAETLDSIHNSIDNQGVLEDAWCEMCHEQQLDRLECAELASSAQQADDEPLASIPDLAITPCYNTGIGVGGKKGHSEQGQLLLP